METNKKICEEVIRQHTIIQTKTNDFNQSYLHCEFEELLLLDATWFGIAMIRQLAESLNSGRDGLTREFVCNIHKVGGKFSGS
jgi:hypothetical protein